MRKRGLFSSGSITSLLLATFCVVFFGRIASAESIRLILNWVPDSEHAPWFVGIEKGFYKEQGLDLGVIAGEGSAKAVKAVAGKAAEYGEADMGEIIKGRLQRIPVRAIAIVLANDLNTIFTLKDSGIGTPKDLEGKTIGAPVWSALRTVFPLFAKINKIDVSKVRWVDMPPAAMAPSLYAGKVDSIAQFGTVEHSIVEGARKIGKEIHTIAFRNWGVSLYSTALQTLDERIKNNPEEVRRFVRASVKSMAWTAKNPQLAVDIMVTKYYPQGKRELELIKWNYIYNSMLTETTLQHGLGYMTEEKVKFTRDAILEGLGKDPSMVPVKELFTNDFLPKRDM